MCALEIEELNFGLTLPTTDYNKVINLSCLPQSIYFSLKLRQKHIKLFEKLHRLHVSHVLPFSTFFLVFYHGTGYSLFLVKTKNLYMPLKWWGFFSMPFALSKQSNLLQSPYSNLCIQWWRVVIFVGWTKYCGLDFNYRSNQFEIKKMCFKLTCRFSAKTIVKQTTKNHQKTKFTQRLCWLKFKKQICLLHLPLATLVVF